jgi:hypothetical protein
MTRLHMAVETDIFGEPELVAVCGNDFHRRKRLTEDESAVTCPMCMKLAGIEATADEQLTECRGDPLRRAA